MIGVLDKYVRFMNLTMASSAEGIRGLKATEMIIKAMNQSDQEMTLSQVKKEEAQEPGCSSDGALDLHIPHS
ncbi:hypothetical protein M8J76_013002 [Diaphorina citri]|nr:hypothetical protein M8J76_013002 [Diaphorina citri]